MRRVPTPYRVDFLRKSRNLYDRYVLSLKPWAQDLWRDWIGLRPGQRVVDVGCGTGHFTRFLARALSGRGHLIGIDNRQISLNTAWRETKKGRLEGIVEYRVGYAEKLPLPDNHADIVVCRTVLMHLKDPSSALKEMCRVAKRGGTVAAIETDFGMRCYYSPKAEDRNELSRKFSKAWLRGVAKLDGKDYTIGSKLPTLFAKVGLERIQANLDADPWLRCDPRRPLSDKLVEVRASLEGLQDFDETRKYLKAGGMSSRDIKTYRKQSMIECKRFVRDPKRLLSDTTFYGACWFIITGRKP